MKNLPSNRTLSALCKGRCPSSLTCFIRNEDRRKVHASNTFHFLHGISDLLRTFPDTIEASSMILDDLRRNSYAVEQLVMEILVVKILN